MNFFMLLALDFGRFNREAMREHERFDAGMPFCRFLEYPSCWPAFQRVVDGSGGGLNVTGHAVYAADSDIMDRTQTHGYAETREAAMSAFAKSWRRE
jgi:hypothetical protein